MNRLLTEDDILEHPDFQTSVDISTSNFRELKSHCHLHLLYILRSLLPKKKQVYLEIGVLWGGTLCLVGKSPYPTDLIGIDLFTINKGAGEDQRERVLENLREREITHKVNLVKGDSENPRVHEDVKSLLDGREINLLLIDGDHERNKIFEDFKAYFPFVSTRGIIVFDDAQDRGVWSGIEDLLEAEHGYQNKVHVLGRLENRHKIASDIGGSVGSEYMPFIMQKL